MTDSLSSVQLRAFTSHYSFWDGLQGGLCSLPWVGPSSSQGGQVAQPGLIRFSLCQVWTLNTRPYLFTSPHGADENHESEPALAGRVPAQVTLLWLGAGPVGCPSVRSAVRESLPSIRLNISLFLALSWEMLLVESSGGWIVSLKIPPKKIVCFDKFQFFTIAFLLPRYIFELSSPSWNFIFWSLLAVSCHISSKLQFLAFISSS